MIGTSQCGEWYSMPTAANWSVNVTKEKMFDVGKITHDLLNALHVFPETDPIQSRNTNLKWGMVHEKINGFTSGCFQLRP